MDFTVVVADDGDGGLINQATVIVRGARDQQQAEYLAREAFALDYWRAYNEANQRSVVMPPDQSAVVAVFAGAHNDLRASATHIEVAQLDSVTQLDSAGEIG